MGALEVRKAEQLAGEQPWNQREVDELGPTIMRFMEDLEPFYRRWAETWYTNLQFVYGNQAVRWSRKYGYAVDVDFLSRHPVVNQRAQTNITRVVAEALASFVYANLPEWAVEAAEQSSIKGKRFKRIVQNLLDAYMQRLCMDVELKNAALIYSVFGAVAADVGWDPIGGRMLDIPQFKKTQAPVFTDWMKPNPILGSLLASADPVLGSNGQPLVGTRWEPVLDAQGKQVINQAFAGDVRCDILTPFEYRRAVGSHGMHKTKYVQRILLLDYDEYLDRYANVPGKTKYWNQVQPIYSNDAVYRVAVRHFMRMQFVTPPGLNELTNRPEGIYRSSMFRTKVLVVEHWDQPHPIKWPRGRRVVVCNGDATHITEPTYATGKMDGWHQMSEAQWLTICPSSLSTGPINDVVAKNRELNIADSLAATAMRRNFGSQLLIKTGTGIDPQRFTGEPGMIHMVPDPYNIRWLHDDMPLPPVLAQLRQAIKDDVYETSGAGDALRGEKSAGAPSGYAQQIIREREEQRLATPRKTFEKFVASIGEKIFFSLVSNVVNLDDQVMGYLMRCAAGEYQVQDVISLVSNKVAMGVEVNVEADSMHLRSKATQQATMADMASQNPAVQQRLQGNPGVLDNFLEFFDAETLRDKSAAHRDRAQRENEQFADMLRLGPNALQGSEPVVILQDDDQIHLDEIDDFFVKNSDEIIRNPQMMTVILTHRERHRIQLMEKQGQVMPGTTQQVPAMMAQTGNTPAPPVTQIYQQTKMQEEQAQKAAQGKKPAGQGPSQPAPVGSGGPPQTAPGTPASKTPAGRQQASQGKVQPQ